MIKMKRALGDVLGMRTSQRGMCKGPCSLYSVVSNNLYDRTFAQVGVRRTSIDKKILIDKLFACRRADSHRFRATHPLFSLKSESPNVDTWAHRKIISLRFLR